MSTETLDWYYTTDFAGSPILQAAGGSTDGESVDLFYGIRKVRRKVRRKVGTRYQTRYLECSSPELMCNDRLPRTWKTLGGAKRAIQRDHIDHIQSYLADE